MNDRVGSEAGKDALGSWQTGFGMNDDLAAWGSWADANAREASASLAARVRRGALRAAAAHGRLRLGGRAVVKSGTGGDVMGRSRLPGVVWRRVRRSSTLEYSRRGAASCSRSWACVGARLWRATTVDTAHGTGATVHTIERETGSSRCSGGSSCCYEQRRKAKAGMARMGARLGWLGWLLDQQAS
ncbi:Os04g0271750 [Oryza sativa Japonica Group]|uniref:Os04g0271750 protein n=1 Tax=Oryza sativa subsp. japonica TaxID=39947 RepID=A0A0P0W7Z8_ORYSJ|nr:Os04g0271750 [Oryza sativa Japonica Group]